MGVEGDIDLPLEAALAVPVGFAVAHQQQARACSFRRQAMTEVRCDIERFDLHLKASIGVGQQVEHRERRVVEPEALKPAGGQPQQLQHQAAQDGAVGHHQHGG